MRGRASAAFREMKVGEQGDELRGRTCAGQGATAVLRRGNRVLLGFGGFGCRFHPV